MLHITIRNDEDGREETIDCDAVFIASNTLGEDGHNTGTCYIDGRGSVQAAAGALTNLVRESDESVGADGLLAKMVAFALNARK